jgi:hypothetical protein
MRNIQIATTPSEIDRCFPVMSQLRPKLIAAEFAGRVQAQQAEGYQLAFLEHEGERSFRLRDSACRICFGAGRLFMLTIW